MSGRELVILLLGLAIVAVVLRGLYVALNARRGQIKLAIDKNIPQNVDLEALEMAELPGGGARVVTRSLEEVNRKNSALDRAESKARAVNLADAAEESHIPVLMDAVELSESVSVPAEVADDPVPPARAEHSSEWEDAITDGEQDEALAAPQMPLPEDLPEELEDIDEEDDPFAHDGDQVPSIGDDWEESELSDDSEVADRPAEEPVEARGAATAQEEDPDEVLFDYEEDEDDARLERNREDLMSSVAPDYEQESDAADDADEATLSEHGAADDEDYTEEMDSNLQQPDEEEDASKPADEPAPFDADNDVDGFSMTAGERIGGNPPPIGESSQAGLFDDDEDRVAVAATHSKKSRSLFGMFGRKAEKQEPPELQTEQHEDMPAEEYDEPDSEAEEAEDVLMQDAAPEEEFVDELDQKRAAAEPDDEAEQAQTGEFEQSEVLVLNVTAKEGRVFAGDDLLHILITSGLKFGDMNIFHKRLSKDNQGSVVFSVANMLNPGTFDLNKMDEFTTLGISFFLALPTPINNLDAFEQMLAVAQQIRDTLGGDLKDDHRNGMTAQTIEHYRQRIRDFELRRLKAVAARG